MSRAASTTSSARQPGRLRSIVSSLLALIVLAVGVVGVPVALVLLVGRPLPSPLPSTAELGDVFSGRAPIPTDYLISALAIVMWFLWAQVLWATLVEVAAAVNGRLARRAPVLPGVQLGVAKLVTAATLLTTSLTVRPVAAQPLMPVAAAQPFEVEAAGAPLNVARPIQADRAASATPSWAAAWPRTQNDSSSPVAYITESGDTWWGIAESHLGSGTRWKEIRAMNLGRTMDDGWVLSASTDLLRPGWRLLLPGAASSRAVTVQPGDTIWGIAEDDLGTESVAEVAAHVAEISDINEDVLDGNPDMIYPGQSLVLPGQSDESGSESESTSESGSESGSESDSDETESTESQVGESDQGNDGETTTATTTVSTTAPPTTSSTTASTAPSTVATPIPETATTAAPTTQGSTTDSPSTTEVTSTTEASTTTEPSTTTGPSTTTAPSTTASSLVSTTAADEGEGSTEDAVEDVAATVSGQGSTAVEPDDDRPRSLAGMEATAPPAIDSAPADRSDDLPTAAPLSSVDTTIPSTADQGALLSPDTQASGSPGSGAVAADDTAVFAGLVGLTLLGGYLYRARARRRGTALRSRKPGRRPKTPPRRTRGVARRLAAASEPEHTDLVNVGLRALGRRLQDVPSSELPKISGVWVSQNRLVIALAPDSPRFVPPTPFTEFADGSGWSLHRRNFDEAKKVAKGANGPIPLLTTVGTTTALDLALTTNSRAPAEAYGIGSSLLFAMDLEAGRVISVQADDEASTIEALTMMALELATAETADQVEVVCVGFGHRLATFDRVMVVEDLAEVLSDLETITGRAVYAAADASPFATRVSNGAADTWNPVVVFHADAFDPHSRNLIELAERAPGGVTAVCGYPTDAGWTLDINGDQVRCPDLPGELAQHEFKRPQLEGIELVPDLFDEASADTSIDDEFWRPLDPVEEAHTWHLLDTDESSWRPMGSVTEPAQPGPTASSSGEPQTRPTNAPGLAVVVNRAEVSPSPDPEVLWDSMATADAEAWPPENRPVLDELRHSVEHRGPDADPDPRDEEVDRFFLDSLGYPATQPSNGRHLYVVDDAEVTADHPAGTDNEAGNEAETDNDVGAETEAGTETEARTETETDDAVGAQGEADPMDGSAPESEAEVADPTIIDEERWPTGPPEVTESNDGANVGRPRFEPGVGSSPAAGGSRVGGSTAVTHIGPPTPAAEPTVTVSVLGNFTIDGHPTGARSKPWKYTKTAELILYLLLHPGGASQDLLMEQLFPEQPANRPRLNQLVSDARTKALGRNADDEYHLPHASPTEPFYRLLPSVGFDLRDFTRHCAAAKTATGLEKERDHWRAALELVRGRPFTLPHDGYEWVLPEAEATIVKVEEAAVALSDIATELGDHRLAVWATRQGLLTGTGYYELLVRRGRAALLLQDPEEIVRAFADLQVSLEHTGAPEEGIPDLSGHPDLEGVYHDLSEERSKDRLS